MQPVPEWRRVLRHAWSIRWMAISVLASAAGAALMMVDPYATGHPYAVVIGAFLLSAVGGLLGLATRFVKQKEFDR